MDVDSAVAMLSEPQVRLAFDTSALFRDRSFAKLCRDLKRLSLHRQSQLELLVSAAVHGEKLFDLKQAYRGSYDYQRVVAGLFQLGLSILPFVEEDACVLGELLGATYPDADSWNAAKRRHYRQSLGLPDGDATGGGKRLSATLDWLIAGHAQARSCVLVTNDEGPEFRHVRQVRLAILQLAVAQLLPCPQLAAPGGQR